MRAASRQSLRVGQHWYADCNEFLGEVAMPAFKADRCQVEKWDVNGRGWTALDCIGRLYLTKVSTLMPLDQTTLRGLSDNILSSKRNEHRMGHAYRFPGDKSLPQLRSIHSDHLCQFNILTDGLAILQGKLCRGSHEPETEKTPTGLLSFLGSFRGTLGEWKRLGQIIE